LREICLQAVAAKAVDGRKMQARYFEPWFEKISAWAADESLEQLDIGTGFTRLTPDGMAEAWKGEPPHHPGIDAMASLKASLDALPTPDAAVLQHAAAWVGKRFEDENAARRTGSSYDMLIRLNAALQSDGGERLASVIREQFPVALIDEFQDTDPVQYSIFDSIYRIEENHLDSGLFLIGRPQAGDLRLPWRRHLHLPARAPIHHRPASHPGHQLPLQPRDGRGGQPCVPACGNRAWRVSVP